MLPLFSLQKITQSSGTTWVTKFCLYINTIIMQPSKSWELVTACPPASFPVWFPLALKDREWFQILLLHTSYHLSSTSASLSSVNNTRITGSDKAILLKIRGDPDNLWILCCRCSNKKGTKKVVHKCDTLPAENRSSMLSEQSNHLGWKLWITAVFFTLKNNFMTT